jgi:RNA polymerase sigma-70 factor (ECF subfamily)
MVDNEKLEEIIIRCQKGDNQAFTELVDMYAKSCYGYFYRLCGNAAVSNDLLSELFIKIVEKIGTYKGGSFKGWLFTVASNLFYDYLRFQYRQKKLLDGKGDTLRYQRVQSDEAIDLKDEIQTYLAKLDDDTAELLIMRFYSQLSFRQLADLRSEPIGTTLSKVHRGLKKLREMMQEDNKE